MIVDRLLASRHARLALLLWHVAAYCYPRLPVPRLQKHMISISRAYIYISSFFRFINPASTLISRNLCVLDNKLAPENVNLINQNLATLKC